MAAGMKITTIDSYVVRIPANDTLGGDLQADDPLRHPGLAVDHPGDIMTEYPPLWRNRVVEDSSTDAVIVRIETDSEMVGWGEAHAPAAEAVRVIIETLLAPLIYGRDPLDIHPIWETLYSTMRMNGH